LLRVEELADIGDNREPVRVQMEATLALA